MHEQVSWLLCRDETLAVLMPVVDDIGWVCEPCHAAAKLALHQLQSGHTKLWEEVGELENAYKKLQGEVIRVRSVCKTKLILTACTRM